MLTSETLQEQAQRLGLPLTRRASNTMPDLAQLVAVDRTTVVRWINGSRAIPDWVETWLRLWALLSERQRKQFIRDLMLALPARVRSTMKEVEK